MPPKRPLITRWTGAVLGFTLGATDTLVLVAFGARFELWIGAYFGVSFVTLGFLLGLVLESRYAERVSALKLAEQSRELAEAEVRVLHADKLASLGQLATAMAHELRNPLAIIRSTVQNLEETLAPGDGEARRSCRFVLEEIDRLSRVTISIVRFARPLVPNRKRLDAGELFARAQALSARMLASRGVMLTSRSEAKEAALEGDPDLVCQALLGLVDNAAHFSQQVTLELETDGDEVVFAVSDRGPGVPEEVRAKLFEPFFTTRPDGTGLGLAVVQQIAKAHGGRVALGETHAHGARFELRLPAARAEELAA